MGCDFIRVDINEHLGDDPTYLGGPFKGHQGDIHTFNCPGLDPNRDAHYFVKAIGMHKKHFFKINGKGPLGTTDPKDGWWIEPSVSPNSKQHQLRDGIIFKGNLKEQTNTIRVYSSPYALGDDFRVYWVLILYPTK